MTEKIPVHLELAVDTPNSMTFEEVYAGLEDIWYRFSSDDAGNVELWGTAAGFEFLGRYFSSWLAPRRSPAITTI